MTTADKIFAFGLGTLVAVIIVLGVTSNIKQAEYFQGQGVEVTAWDLFWGVKPVLVTLEEEE